ncbi:hypothetical protein HDU90_004303 [Geranomyces variabilis]|nr:hypothetical protein HDU90_004303 [Geranomyces variabilis]
MLAGSLNSTDTTSVTRAGKRHRTDTVAGKAEEDTPLAPFDDGDEFIDFNRLCAEARALVAKHATELANLVAQFPDARQTAALSETQHCNFPADTPSTIRATGRASSKRTKTEVVDRAESCADLRTTLAENIAELSSLRDELRVRVGRCRCQPPSAQQAAALLEGKRKYETRIFNEASDYICQDEFHDHDNVDDEIENIIAAAARIASLRHLVQYDSDRTRQLEAELNRETIEKVHSRLPPRQIDELRVDISEEVNNEHIDNLILVAAQIRSLSALRNDKRLLVAGLEEEEEEEESSED